MYTSPRFATFASSKFFMLRREKKGVAETAVRVYTLRFILLLTFYGRCFAWLGSTIQEFLAVLRHVLFSFRIVLALTITIYVQCTCTYVYTYSSHYAHIFRLLNERFTWCFDTSLPWFQRMRLLFIWIPSRFSFLFCFYLCVLKLMSANEILRVFACVIVV